MYPDPRQAVYMPTGSMHMTAGYNSAPSVGPYHWDYGVPVASTAFGASPAPMGGVPGSTVSTYAAPRPMASGQMMPGAGAFSVAPDSDQVLIRDSTGSLDSVDSSGTDPVQCHLNGQADSSRLGGSMATAASHWWETIHKRGDEALQSLPTLLATVNNVVEVGKRRVDDAASMMKRPSVFGSSAATCAHHHEDRSSKRVLIVAPGFGLERDPRQANLVIQAGFQVHFVTNIPNPEQTGFQMHDYLPYLKACIDEFKPNVIVCASKGGHYMIALWQTGLWRGPSVMINAQPCLKELPEDVPVVVAQGSNDEIYTRSRAEMENLISTGSSNMCFLYYTGNGGKNSAGQCARVGDKHDMESLLTYDCLPRLIDASMCPQGPEMHMLWSWRNQLSKQRLAAEQWLSYCPEELQRLWASTGHKGLDADNLFEVPKASQEYQMVADIFHSSPVEPAAYPAPDAWNDIRILRVDRVENGWQEEGSAKPYYSALRRSIEDQGVCFQPGVHTRWVFHGTDAIESIISNPLAGFQPLASGSRLGSVWGSGTYFARDATYVLGGNFCQRAADGTRQMLMCLAMIGFPCLGDPEQKGVLPFREKPHRCNSSVDSLSSPEIFIVQHPSAAYPAYLITFA